MNSTATIIEIIDMFIADQDVSVSSRKSYRMAVKHFFIWVTNNLTYNKALNPEVRRITRAMIIQYKRSMEEKNTSSLSIGLYIAVLRKFFAWTESQNIHENVAKGIKGPKKYKGYRKDPLSVDQSKALLRSMDRSTLKGKRNYAIMNLLLFNGLRTIEVTRANVGDLTFRNGEHVLYLQGKGCTTKDEYSRLEDNVMDALHAYLLSRESIADDQPLFASLNSGGRRSADTTLPRSHKGGSLSTRTLACMVKDQLSAIGINSKKITAHSLRHTAGILIIKGGGSIYDVQLFLRHGSTVVTEIYTRYIEEEMKIENKAGKILASILND